MTDYQLIVLRWIAKRQTWHRRTWALIKAEDALMSAGLIKMDMAALGCIKPFTLTEAGKEALK